MQIISFPIRSTNGLKKNMPDIRKYGAQVLCKLCTGHSVNHPVIIGKSKGQYEPWRQFIVPVYRFHGSAGHSEYGDFRCVHNRTEMQATNTTQA